MELLAKPGVAGIIEKTINGVDCILVQERYKEDAPKETGLLEIPAGKIRAFECIFDTLRREIEEETGLEVVKIYGEEESQVVMYNNYKVVSYKPFACSQNIMGEYPIMVSTFICRVEGTLLSESNESKNIRWMSLKEVSTLLEKKIDYFYPMHITSLRKYLKMKNESNKN